MTISKENRKELIKCRIEQSYKAYEDVVFLIRFNKYNLAVNRIYYGIFYILSALALKHKFETSKHQQLIGWFNKTYVKEDLIDKNIAAIVHKAFNKRSKSDYSAYVEFTEKRS